MHHKKENKKERKKEDKKWSQVCVDIISNNQTKQNKKKKCISYVGSEL